MAPLLRSLFHGWRAVALVALVCAPPSRAAAECGSHVVILNPQTSFASTDHATPSPIGAAERPDSPRVPCSGPNCSRAPDRSAPPFAPVPASGPHAKEAAPVLGSLEGADTPPSRVCESTSPRPVYWTADIFRPPPLVGSHLPAA